MPFKHVPYLALTLLCMPFVFSTYARQIRNPSMPSQARRVVSPQLLDTNIREEIDAWFPRMSEHCVFYHLMLEEPTLKKRALELHNKAQSLLNGKNKYDKNALLAFLKELRVFKADVLKRQTRGQWVGWLVPGFSEHTISELDWLKDIVEGKQKSPQEILAFVNKDEEEHMALTGILLDPSEQVAFEKTQELRFKFAQMPKNEYEMMLKLSIQYGDELDAFAKALGARVRSGGAKSVIHPLLLDHMEKEQQYDKQKKMKLSRLLEQQSGKN